VQLRRLQCKLNITLRGMIGAKSLLFAASFLPSAGVAPKSPPLGAAGVVLAPIVAGLAPNKDEAAGAAAFSAGFAVSAGFAASGLAGSAGLALNNPPKLATTQGDMS
jgi:hypothetical protein